MTEIKRGGPGRGQGRKPLKAGEDTVSVCLRMAQSQRDKLARLGGAKWVRAQIDSAAEQPDSPAHPSLSAISSGRSA